MPLRVPRERHEREHCGESCPVSQHFLATIVDLQLILTSQFKCKVASNPPKTQAQLRGSRGGQVTDTETGLF